MVERSRSQARAARIEKLKVERDLERIDKIWILQKVERRHAWHAADAGTVLHHPG